MKIENIVYDIKHLLNALTDDTRIADGHLIFKINNYWAIFLKEDYNQTGILNKSAYQRIPLITSYPVSSADDPSVDGGTIKFSKITVPKLIQLGEREPAMDLWMSQKHQRIYFIDRDTLMEMIIANDELLDIFKYYIYEGNDVYIYPVVGNVSFAGLLETPMDASMFYTTPEALFDLTAEIEYIVTSGSVKAGTTVYLKGETFTAVSGTTYSGDGVVYRSTKVIDANKDMEYPISSDMAERIVLEILSKDFMLEKQSIFDIFNDSADQFKAVRSGK